MHVPAALVRHCLATNLDAVIGGTQGGTEGSAQTRRVVVALTLFPPFFSLLCIQLTSTFSVPCQITCVWLTWIRPLLQPPEWYGHVLFEAGHFVLLKSFYCINV